MPLDPSSYDILQRGLSTWADRRERNKDRTYEQGRDTRLDQLQAERDALHRRVQEMELEARNFDLGQRKKTATASNALTGMDFSQIGYDPSLPPDFVGPPEAKKKADLGQPWHQQDPQIQQIIASQLAAAGVSRPQTAQAFNQNVTAQTGKPVMPAAPQGMRPSKFEMDGFQFEPEITPPPGARPTQTRIGDTTYEYPPIDPVPAKIQPVMDPTGNPMPGLYTGPDGKAHPLPRNAAPTEAQSNARIYAERMKFAEDALGPLESQYDPTALMRLPQNEMFRVARSDAGNQYIDTKRNWISAALRKESGAAISTGEYEAADKQYFPQLGDSPQAIAQKKKLRELVQSEMRGIGTPPSVELPFAGEISPPPGNATQPPPPQGQGTQEAPIPVQSQPEYDALPPGSWYIDSSGVPKRKRG